MPKKAINKKKKQNKKIIISLVIVAAVVLLSIGYYFIFIFPKSDTYFLNSLQESAQNKQSLEAQWSKLASRAKTPTHYLMLLKRLDAFNLQKEYQSTLIRALWKYPKVNSIVVLGVEYYLSLSLGEIPSDVYTPRDIKALKKATADAVDVLWNEYPNMVRLYYVIRFKNKDTSVGIDRAFETDEILSLYKTIVSGKAQWQDYNNIWLLTERKIFLYLAAIRAEEENEHVVAQNFYQSIDEDFLFALPQRALESALLFRNTDIVEKYVSYFPTQDATLALASLYTISSRFQDAWNTLQTYVNSHESDFFTYDWDSLQFWLMTHLPALKNYVEDGVVLDNVKRMYNIIRQRHLKTDAIDYEYFTYLYLQDANNLLDLYEDPKQDIFPPEFLRDFRVDFLVSQIKKINDSGSQRVIYLWKILEKSEDDVLWQRVAASYFISLNLKEEVDILFSRYDTDVLVPYKLLWYLKKGNKSEVKKIVKNATYVDYYPWWFYYNVALFHFEQKRYAESQSALELAQQKYDLLYVNKFGADVVDYHIYIWAQFARLAMFYLSDYELAREYIEKIRNAEVSFVYLAELEQDLQFFE